MPALLQVLQLADAPLKHLLRLFDPDTSLHIRALGDTLHPSAGYVGQELVQAVTQVDDLMAFPYDFAGLVNFEAVAGDVTITYQGERYQLTGHPKAMQRLLAQLRALNSLADAQPLTVLNTTPISQQRTS